MNANVIKYINFRRKKAIKSLSELISIPTINPPGRNYEKMAVYLSGKCRKLGLTVKRYSP